MNKYVLISLAFLLTTNLSAQVKKLTLNGYIKDLGMYYKPTSPFPVSATKTVDYLASDLIHNRLNFRYYPSDKLTFAVEIRNRIFFGQMIRELPLYRESIDVDNGYYNLSEIIASGDGWFMHSIVDRAWMDYTKGNWQLTLGRQRINWGINLVWNPNDIFNTFSFFDFDYEERPGTDAIKIQYYTGVTSSLQLVYRPGRSKYESAGAGMYRFSKFNYDFQFLGGWVGKDYTIGGGWSGDIRGGGFRGEVSCFLPTSATNGSKESLVISVSGDYALKNSLYLHTGILYNSLGIKGNAGGRSFFDQSISAKMLSLAMVELFGQISYPFTPLFSGNFSGMLNPMDGSSFIGPSFSYSLSNNLEIMINGQLFFGKKGSEYGDYGKAFFGRIKWAF